MEANICKNCGAKGLIPRKEYWYCEYCDSKFFFTKKDIDRITSAIHSKNCSLKSSQITLSADIDRLLQKCITDKKNARKYANLILDIDPDNVEALMYL